MWHCYAAGLHAYDFVIKDFSIKRGIICFGYYIWNFTKQSLILKINRIEYVWCLPGAAVSF